MSKVSLMIVILIWIGAVLLGTAATLFFTGDNVYTGKELFTPAQYEEFKMAVADEDITISEAMVLSSDPILVQFTVNAPKNQVFPYGEIDGEATYGPAWFIGILGFSCVAAPLFVLATDN